MLLDKNGGMSSSKRTKHINIRYYFIKDQIDKEEVDVIHCPPDVLVMDYFIKPMQGSMFIRLRGTIIGLTCFDSINQGAY